LIGVLAHIASPSPGNHSRRAFSRHIPPTSHWEDPGYAHTHAPILVVPGTGSFLIFCATNAADTQALNDPKPDGILFQKIVQVINNGL
jgi:hypothetical protein